MNTKSFLYSIKLKATLLFLIVGTVEITSVVAQDFTDRKIGDFKYDLYNNTLKAVVKSHIYDTDVTGSLVIPSSVTYTDYQNITRTYSVEEIGSWAFDNCIGLTDSLIIPNSVKKIGDHAFYGCRNIKTIDLGNGILGAYYIGNEAFYLCDGLTSPAFNDFVFVRMSTTYQGKYTLPDVKQVSNYAFNGCRLDTLIVPEKISIISSWAFYGCHCRTIYYNAIDCGLQGVDVYGSGTVVGGFFDFNRLKKVVIGNNVEKIPAYLFRGCEGLNDVLIGKNVTSIGMEAFKNCRNLKNIFCPQVYPPDITYYSDTYGTQSSYNTFYGVPYSCTLHIPCNGSGYTDWKFQKETYAIYEINAYPNNPSWGSVEIIEEPHCSGFSTLSVIQATPFSGYQFSKWYDGNTENPRTVTLTQDSFFYAIFEVGNGIEEFNDDVRVYVQGSCIVVEGADDEPVMVYDMVGRQIKDYSRELPMGIYLVKVGSLHARKVVIAQ